MISLKDFIKDTLSQIVDARSEFAAEKGDIGATTNPVVSGAIDGKALTQHGIFHIGWGSNGEMDYATVITFDVAVTAEESEQAKAGGGVKVLSLVRADGGLEAQTVNSTASRVQFKLPLQLTKV